MTDNYSLTRKQFLRLGMTSILSGSVAASGSFSTLANATGLSRSQTRFDSGRRPNILFICTDQERARHLLPDGLPLPAHDLLQAGGTNFRRYNVNTSPCGPSRSVIYTGQHTQNTGVYLNPNSSPNPELSTECNTIGDMLRAAGYYTAYKGKWHLSNLNDGKIYRGTAGGIYPNSSDVLEPFGFSDYQFDGEKVGLTWEGFIQDAAIAGDTGRWLFDWRDRGNPEQPWFLAVNFVNPHDIMFFDATGSQAQTRARKNFIAPLVGAPGDSMYRQRWNFDLPRSFYEDDLSSKPECHRAINYSQNAFYGEMPREDLDSWRAFQEYYFNCLRDVDRHIMTVLDALEASGMSENTIVIFTSDHGERAGAHGMRQKAGTVYREDTNVPLIIRHPDIKGGVVNDRLFSSIDLVPTVLGFAGIDKNKYPELKGFDLSCTLSSPHEETKRDLAGHLFNYACGYYWDSLPPEKAKRPTPKNDGMETRVLDLRRLHRGILFNNYKFARYFAPAEHHTPGTWEQLTAHNDLEFYDVAEDPCELRNLALDGATYRDQLTMLNEKANTLIRREVGTDNGAEYEGDSSQYNTL